MIYMGVVSSALIAFGFVSSTGDLAPFIAAVLPALLLFGELTFAQVAPQHDREPHLDPSHARHPLVLPVAGAR